MTHGYYRYEFVVSDGQGNSYFNPNATATPHKFAGEHFDTGCNYARYKLTEKYYHVFNVGEARNIETQNMTNDEVQEILELVNQCTPQTPNGYRLLQALKVGLRHDLEERKRLGIV